MIRKDAAVRYVPGSAEPGRPSEPADARRSRGRGRPPRVLLLDGGTVAAALTTRELNGAELQVITERMASENALVSAVRAFAPDVILVDQVLRQFDAVAALALLRALQSAVPLIVVAGALDTASVVAAFRAGAEDVILDSDLSRLGTAVAAAVAVRQPLQELSPRQREVLRLMADGQSTREIAQLLRISVKTVETHRGELMRRLGIRGVPGLTRYALRVGLVNSDPEDSRTTGPRWDALAHASRS